MRTITPWIDRLLLTAVCDKSAPPLPKPPVEKIAIFKKIYSVRKVRITDGEQVKEAYFTFEVLRQFQQTFGEAYVSEVPKHYVSVQALLARIAVNGAHEYVIRLTRADILEKMPKKEDIPEPLSCYLRSNGTKGSSPVKEPPNGTTANVSSPVENITFKSDAMNLIKRAVNDFASHEKVSNLPEIQLDRMKSRMGAALTGLARSIKLDSEQTGDTPSSSSPVKDASPADVSVSTPTCEVRPNLRSSSSGRKCSLRSGRTYGESDRQTPDKLTPKPRKRKPQVEKTAIPVKKPKVPFNPCLPVGKKSGRGNISVGQKPGTSGLQNKRFAKRLAKANEEQPPSTMEEAPSTVEEAPSQVQSTSSPECVPPTSPQVPSTFAANKRALLMFIKAEPKEEIDTKEKSPKKPSVTSSPEQKVFSRGRTSEHGSPSVPQALSAWDISPPLLETMKNFVHKHFAMWNR